MEIEIEYEGLIDRKQKVENCEKIGLRMLHDNFFTDWEAGDEPRGVMIFTDEIPITPAPILLRDLAAEIDALKTKIDILESKIEVK